MKEMLAILLFSTIFLVGGLYIEMRKHTANHELNIISTPGLAGTQTPSLPLHSEQPGQATLIDDIIDVLIQVESGGDPCAIGDGGKAVGVLQIWPIAVRDVNRILGEDRYTLADRFSPSKSRQMCHIVIRHYCLRKFQESAARRWVGGTHNQNTPDADRYWERVIGQLKRKVK